MPRPADKQPRANGRSCSGPCRTSLTQPALHTYIMSNLDLVFAKMATNTLLARCGPLLKFARWLLRSFPTEDVTENVVFVYLQSMEKKQPESSGPDQLLKALNFVNGTIGLHQHVSTYQTGRLRGLAHVCLKKQKPPRQAPPLTVAEVFFLRKLADARRCNMILPLVAPIRGVMDEPWALSWHRLRSYFSRLENSSLQPVIMADGSLARCTLPSCETSRWLRAILGRQPQVEHSRLHALTSHSLKATCLSWTSKATIDHTDQKLLGYHSPGNSQTELCYSRDALSGPLRSLEKELSSIRQGIFHPGCSRSGRWQEPDASPPSSSSSHSQGLDTCSEGSSDSDGEATQVAHTCSHTVATVLGSGEHYFLRNPTSKAVGSHMQEGRRPPVVRTHHFSGLKLDSHLNFADMHSCLTCQSVAEGLLDNKWAHSSGARS